MNPEGGEDRGVMTLFPPFAQLRARMPRAKIALLLLLMDVAAIRPTCVEITAISPSRRTAAARSQISCLSLSLTFGTLFVALFLRP